nr:hypothetical protein L204_01561 [Cryptococcus depauperatus CBS 7855]
MADQLINRLVPQIREILATSDLSTISAKAIRKQLLSRGENENEIKSSRAAIDEKACFISEIYDGLIGDDSFPVASSPEGHQSSQTNKHLSSPSKPSSKPNNRKKRPASKIETDEQMAKRLQQEYDSGIIERPRRTGNAAKPAKKRKIKGREQAKNDEESASGDDNRKASRGGGFHKELLLSEPLTDLVGSSRLSRPQVVKQIWDYVKGHELQDQTDKRYILCDEKLKRVFYTDRLHMFTMNKLLVDHLRDPEDVI